MGAIDEKVINTLNFLCDLGKIIEYEAVNESNEKDITKNNQEKDIFPDLLWVLRDFSLQNLPEYQEDSKLTPNEYLENMLKSKSLSPKNSDLDNSLNNSYIEDSNNISANFSVKNLIHENIKKYFPRRECFTLISPILEEISINNKSNNNSKIDLNNLPDEKFRREFLEQILALRKRIINNCKKKSFNGIKITPEHYRKIIIEYIQIFNSGKLPEMNSIWKNLCDWENQKALQEAENTYIDIFKRNLPKKPVDNNELTILHDQAKEKSLEIFKRKSIGNFSALIRKSLKKKIDENLSVLANLNEEENKNEIFNFLKNQFTKIEIKLKNNEINTLDEINKEVEDIENKIYTNFPNTNTKKELVLDFKSKIVYCASSYIFIKLSNEINSQKEKVEEAKASAKIQKQSLDVELNNTHDQLTKKNLDILKLKDQFENLEQRSALKSHDYEKAIQANEEKISRIKEESLKQTNDFQEKIANLEKKNLETELKSYEIRENFEKEKAALIIKIEYLSKTVDEYAKKEKNYNNEIQNQLKENTIINKNTLNNYENQISDMNNLVLELKDKILDLENNLHKNEHILEVNRTELGNLQLKYYTEKNELVEKNNLLKVQFDNFKSKANEEIDAKDSKITKLESLLRQKDTEFFEKIKSTEDNLKSQISKLEKDLILEQQAKHFLEVKHKELVNSSKELKDRYENVISNLEKKNFNDNTESKEKSMELRNSLEIEKKQMEENLEKLKKNYFLEIQNLNLKISDMENSSTLKNLESERIIKEIKELNEKFKNDISFLQKSKNKLEEEKNVLIEESNSKYKKTLQDFEKRFEDKEKSHKKEIESLNKNYDQTITHYKQLFDTEKNRLEEKVNMEKIKFEKKKESLQEEYENKIKEIEKENKNELSHCNEEYEELEENYQKYIFKTDSEIKELNKHILDLEASLKEAKENFNMSQLQFNINLEKKNEMFDNERKELQKKIEQLNKDINFKDQEITSLKFKKENLEKENEEYENRKRKDKEMIDTTVKKLYDENEELKIT